MREKIYLASKFLKAILLWVHQSLFSISNFFCKLQDQLYQFLQIQFSSKIIPSHTMAFHINQYLWLLFSYLRSLYHLILKKEDTPILGLNDFFVILYYFSQLLSLLTWASIFLAMHNSKKLRWKFVVLQKKYLVSLKKG